MRHARQLLFALLVVAALVTWPALASAAQAPNATTGGAQDVIQTSALLTGRVNPHGTGTTYYFQYGTTAGYGKRTASHSAGNGYGAIAVQAKAYGLAASTRYHYRIVAVSSAGTTRGADRVFATPAPVVPEPSKLELARATISSVSRYIDVLAPISARASGTVSLELYGAHQVHRWTAPIDSADGRILTRETIPGAQADLGTGILTISYPGDADTRPQVVRLRAANVHANLDAQRPALTNGHLVDSGTINPRARGVVRVQLEYFSGGQTTTLEQYAPIADGRWSLDYALSPQEQAAIAARRGVVHSYILFTGYLPARMRGEMQAYEVLGAP
ncbi:MAG TPA: hypothetical protein VHB30_13865 [Solirubrobacteraceae bacterium]|jgi:hypothetical protein|nr:hypothetical protein [Solirubrobacteraceae bacterium]